MGRYQSFILLLSSVVLCFSNLARAQDMVSSTENSQDLVVGEEKVALPDEGTASRGLRVNPDDITLAQAKADIPLNASQLHEAEVWGLTSQEEQRYVYLMQNKSGVFYRGRHLSPVWILGLNARTDSERTHYAELAAQQEAQYVVQNLAWETAFHQAYKDLTADLPVVKPFDLSPYSPITHEAVKWQANDVVNYFVNPKEPVGNALTSLLMAQQQYSSLRLNFYFVGHPSNQAIQTWANQQSLPLDWVRSGRITLNQGDGLLASLGRPNKTTPLILLVRNGQSIPLDAGSL